MKSVFLKILFLLLVPAAAAFSQHYEPLELAKKVFDRNGFPDLDKYITGEYGGYKGEPNGLHFSLASTKRFLLLEQKENSAVVNMTMLDSMGRGFDSYLHFVKDSVWKITAFRALAMTGITERMVEQLEKMTPEDVEKAIEKSKSIKDKDAAFINSREDFDFHLGNARLTIELDDNIIKHFLSNRSEFERLKDIALKQLEANKNEKSGREELIENLKPAYRKLFIMEVSSGYYEVGRKNLNFLIGGILDNMVGFIFVKDKKDLPSMSPDRLIMLREIGNGWYLYKTT